ncbi:carbohydrate kinase [Ignicoccus pacificus DSM 13166]|uniref:Bifunctional NAD(P)H-hydrate repair enzyme n=1 Tax=Ignicoccus pacificus DSM 13166 TaxID=940294 RepID=A0A977KA50_9CREN|nr:carbohydrate kinase [Ignicoccus pacificus DSM 13166]
MLNNARFRGEFYDVREMRAVELNSASLGFSEELMMENAGAWVAKVARSKGESFLILVGKGGKGGDGLVAARHLALMGAEVMVLFPYKECEIKKETTKKNLERAKMSGVRFVKEFTEADVIIDALLGTGVKGMPRSPAKELIEQSNDFNAFKIAIDLPSGMDPDTGECELCFEADLIVTMHAPKPGLKNLMDKVIVAEIGIPKRADQYLGPGDLLLRPRGIRKGSNGRVAVIGGSKRYQGAPWISALAAFRAGADLVYVYTPTRMDFPELIWRKRTGTRVEEMSLKEALEKDRINVIVVGPGLAEEALEITKEVLEYAKEKDVSLVLDADSLKVLPEIGEKLGWKAVLTPHLGEASKLLGRSLTDSPKERMEAAFDISDSFEACVILKGPIDVVACKDKLVLNTTGNEYMTVGGTGDALSGVVGALLGRDEPWWAAKATTYAVGKSGEICVEERGHASPTCLIETVPKVLHSVK